MSDHTLRFYVGVIIPTSLTLYAALRWRHNGRDCVSNHQPYDCLLNSLFRQIKENIKALRHWPLRQEFTGPGEFPAQMASNAENVSIWWRHQVVWLISVKECACDAILVSATKLGHSFTRSDPYNAQTFSRSNWIKDIILVKEMYRD